MALDIDVWVARFVYAYYPPDYPAPANTASRRGHGNEIDQFLEVRSLLCPEADLEK